MNLNDLAIELTPTPEQQAEMEAKVASLIAKAQAKLDANASGEATVQGSIAKGTWLAGTADVDLFLLLDPATPESQFEEITEAVANGILTGAQKKYAQHPYLVGSFEGLDVDIVPAYNLPSAADKMSAVDRTPFHTAWVKENLTPDLRQDVRLCKQWCKGTGVYGAETAIGGFSGYLLEVLIVLLGGFDKFLDWLAEGASGPLAIGQSQAPTESPLVVADPVDITRNVAAAVTAETLSQAIRAARAFGNSGSRKFFFPRPSEEAAEPVLRSSLQAQSATWVGLRMRAKTDRLDIVYPQFQRAARMYAESLERAGFAVHRIHVSNADPDIFMQFVTADTELPATIMHRGPPADKEPNASKYRAKWDGHPDAVGGVEEVDGTLCVQLKNHTRTAELALAKIVKTQGAGKHVQKALQDHEIISNPAIWAKRSTDFVLNRQPWER